ncbi:MAG: hypothetical protein ABH811_01250 [archaeon]
MELIRIEEIVEEEFKFVQSRNDRIIVKKYYEEIGEYKFLCSFRTPVAIDSCELSS